MTRAASAALTTHHHPLTDEHGLECGRFEQAVETTLQAYKAGGPILVHGQSGIFRSAAVLETVIAIDEECTFSEAMDEVKAARERASPRRDPRESAERLIQRRSLRRLAWE